MFVENDLADDGDHKDVLAIPSDNAMFLKTLDVVDVSGSVVIHLNLDGGFARVLKGGGLEAWYPSSSNGYEHDVIRFTNGQWRVTSQDHQSDTQAQPNDGAGGFTP